MVSKEPSNDSSTLALWPLMISSNFAIFLLFLILILVALGPLPRSLFRITTDELSALNSNVIIPRARRSAAILSQRRTASEMGRYMAAGNEDDDSDEDGEVGNGFKAGAGGGSAAIPEGESEEEEEAELEF